MDALASRVAARYLTALSLEDRIKAIPGWHRSNFLTSLLTQVQRSGRLSDKQIAALEKIEGERKVPKFDVEYGRRGYYDKPGIDQITALFRTQDTVRVLDRNNILRKVQFDKAILRELQIDFEGAWENYEEYNADEDDPERREHNSEMAGKYMNAAEAMAKADIRVSEEGPVLILHLEPSYEEVRRRAGLR